MSGRWHRGGELGRTDHPRYCPYCGNVDGWKFGLVYHRDYIHVKVRSQPYWPGTMMILATIVERTYCSSPIEGKDSR